jgi:glutathione-specific gamma-glutamylcyclotransferase
MSKVRQMALTPELVSRIHRVVEDTGPEPGVAYHTDEDYDSRVRTILEQRDPGAPVWLFAYGSLIWKPEIEHVEERAGTARGWHRAFCLRQTRWRGTKEQPGLMMALDRGGQCRGVLYRLPDTDLDGQLGKLFRREFTLKPPNNIPRWIAVETETGPVRALTFVMNRKAQAYTGRLPPEEVADVLARACGHWGPGAEYLRSTVAHLEERGTHDRQLWRLQEVVAERIACERSG